MEVSVELSVVSATAASGGRSISKRFRSSAAKGCASAAEPPLPQASTLPPRLSVSARSAPARAIGSGSERAASSLSWGLSAKWALTRAASASFTAPDSTPSLDEHLDLDAPGRIRVRSKAADARLQRRAAVEAPRERGIVALGHIAELAATPGDGDCVGIVRVFGLRPGSEGVTHANPRP